MPRMRPLESHEVDSRTRALFDAFVKARGGVPPLLAVLSRRPSLARAAYNMLGPVLEEGTVSTRLKELVASRVSIINGCHY
ncbi:MAG: carboxymuconolactone decarboxylase family protein [Planctomycetota bacterium]